MSIWELIWERLGLLFSALGTLFSRLLTRFIGTDNARQLRRLEDKVAAINALEPGLQQLSDDELQAQTTKLRERLRAGETLDAVLVDAFATCREAGRRFLEMRHYDVQLVGGMVLHSGKIAEMITGEGKTLVATLPAYLNALTESGVHVVTVNDYLARRDMEWMGPIYRGLGLTVGAIQSNMPVEERQEAYSCDITYGTNNEFGFDYLRDNMRPAARNDDRYPKHLQQSQGPLHFAIVDEVDNILIDEARTPLIISGPAFSDVRRYAEADTIARKLKPGEDFVVNEKDHTAHLTDAGIRAAEKLAGVESFYTAGNMDWPHLIDNSLKAHHLYQRDVKYVVKEGRVVIVDDHTGRLQEGRQWSDGLHQAIEAKERVKIKEETQTLATITLQNFFKLYDRCCGMTGTAMTEAEEFAKIYGLDTIEIPPNRELQRKEHADKIYSTEKQKFLAVANEIEEFHKWDVVRTDKEFYVGSIVSENASELEFRCRNEKKNITITRSDKVQVQRKGRPVLVGTVSIEKSERISKMLDQRGIPHEVLNAKFHEREADIVAQAGRLFAVTIATNMAGRGTDIILGGNAETMAWSSLQHRYETRLDVPPEEFESLVNEIDEREGLKEAGEQVKELGGLHVIGTERHEARRIDLQLRGRTGRQGDPGSSQFFLSLEDDLMRIFAGEWVKKILTNMGWEEDQPIESPMVSRRIAKAQKKVEERHFDARKNLLEYDEVMDEQRKRVYQYRQRILDGVNCRNLIVDAIHEQVDQHLTKFLAPDYGSQSFASWASHALSGSDEILFEDNSFHDMEFKDAVDYAIDSAKRKAETSVLDALDENLPYEVDESDWNWTALAKTANQRWGLSLRDRDLKKVGRDNVADLLIKQASEAIDKVDLSDGKVFLEKQFGLRTIQAWLKGKFGLEVGLEDVQELDSSTLKAKIRELATSAYNTKEAEYPVMVGLMRYSTNSGSSRLEREPLVGWAQERLSADITLDDLKSKQREEIRNVLFNCSVQSQQRSFEIQEDANQLLDKLFGPADSSTQSDSISSSEIESRRAEAATWLDTTLNATLDLPATQRIDRGTLQREIDNAIEARYHPEMRRMERLLLLDLVDAAWKDHLLAMDHLRSSIGLAGYAQKDPKVEYKREGMEFFNRMWLSLGERITDMIFRMEEFPEDFVGSTWVGSSEEHKQASSAVQHDGSSESANDGAEPERLKPIRKRGVQIRRNDPCHCGSGKKYKACCLRKDAVA
ncbi:MAG: preprotein translocase subunit SecA [Planctomycetaceae bacterium]|nr:preprotein translocase subunit SecA [Planctomycetaceae bacterium]